MANPKAHTLIDVFLPDGFGAFGFGAGGFGGNLELQNPQWNIASGNYGFDDVVGLPYVEATSSPSYVAASPFDITYDSFFAKIVPAPAGNGNIQTALLVRSNNHNYVEVSVGPQGTFNFYVSNNSVITLPNNNLPNYDPTAHAYWRIRNDGFIFHFDTSPDGSTWTEQANIGYDWDATNVIVMFFAGFNGSEDSGQRAYISHVNLPGTTLALSATGGANASASGLPGVTSPGQLSGHVNAQFGVSAKFTATLGIPEGGLTDFSISQNHRDMDPLVSTNFGGGNSPLVVGASPISRAAWVTGNDCKAVPVAYRDGSYFPQTRYVSTDYQWQNIPDGLPNLLTMAQSEFTSGLSNRYSVNLSTYATGTFFAPGPGVHTVTRSTSIVLTGQYSGQITSTNSPGTLGTGAKAYWLVPTSVALTPVKTSAGGTFENVYGSISLSTARANTQWLAGVLFFDANYAITAGTVFNGSLPTGSLKTHPGSNVWQNSAVFVGGGALPPTTKYMAVVPIVLNPSNLVETVYVSNHFICGAALYFSEQSSTFNNPNTMNVNIQADRVNYVLNGGFNTNTSLYSQTNTNTTGSPSPVTLSWDNTTGFQTLGSAKLTFTTPSGTWAGNSTTQMGMGSPFLMPGSGSAPGTGKPTIQGLKVGHTYTISAWIKQGPGCPDVFMNCLDANFAASGNGIANVSTNAAKSANGAVSGWTQISGTFTVPFNGLPDMGLFFYVNYQDFVGAGENFSFWVDDIMLEESTTANSFFDGNTATNDYMWESGGTANASRSYYYSNFTNKVTRLNTALPAVIPVGASYNLEFAQPIQAS